MLTVAQTAKHLNVSQTTVRDLVRRGLLRASRVGRCVRIDAADIEQYLLSRVIVPTAPAPPRRSDWRAAWAASDPRRRRSEDRA